MNSPASSSPPNTVVVIEDDVLLRSLMVEAVESLGLDTVEFATADDALLYVMRTSSHVALILADLTVPGQIDGVELANLLHPRHPELPIIVTTGYIDADRDLGSWISFLPKPWTLQALIEDVARLTGRPTET